MKTILKSNQERDAFIKAISMIDCDARYYVAEFKIYRKPRTLPQNRLFHAILNCLIKETEAGAYTFDELKEIFLIKYSPYHVKVLEGKEFVIKKRSHELNSKEMTVLIDGVYRDGVEIFGATYLPRPGEYLFDEFYAKYY
jgi:hypothetical protein